MQLVPEFQCFEKSIVIDSMFSSRRKLLIDLQTSRLFQRVIEAKSVVHGIDLLDAESVDACLLGPSVSPSRSIEFIQKARALTPDNECAYLVVLPTLAPSEAKRRVADLVEVGVHGILNRSYTKRIFTKVVSSAVRTVTRNAEHKRNSQAKLKAITAFEEQSREILSERYLLSDIDSLSDRLLGVAGKFREIAQNISCGELSILDDGTPSTETCDALQDIFEQTLGLDLDEEKTRLKEYAFASCLTEWFVDITKAPAESATNQLRTRLIGLAEGE